MSISSLWENVSSGIVLQYIFPLGMVAFVLVALTLVWPEYDGTLIVLFAFFVFIWSLWFPGKQQQNRALPKQKVDFWYYSLAIAGVVLFFSVQGDRREKVLLASQYAQAEESLSSLREEKEFLEGIAGQHDEMMVEIVAHNHEWAERSRQIHANCPPKGSIGEGDLKMHPELAYCLIKLYDLSIWEALERASNIEQLEAAIEEHSLEDTHISVRGRNLSWPEAVAALRLASDHDAHSAQLLNVNGSIESAATNRDTAKARFRSIGADIQKEKSSVGYDRVEAFIWPYLLIMALGMKLARERYAYSD